MLCKWKLPKSIHFFHYFKFKILIKFQFKINCRRGECYCIDKNGQQTSIEVNEDDISTLSCYTAPDDLCDYTL